MPPDPLQKSPMSDQHDPYREALVLETDTVWPPEYDGWDASQKASVANRLHADPAQASNLEYVRLHSGFCRRIHVTAEDIARIS
jgi:hypothetical protein